MYTLYSALLMTEFLSWGQFRYVIGKFIIMSNKAKFKEWQQELLLMTKVIKNLQEKRAGIGIGL